AVSTIATRLRGVAWIDQYHLDTRTPCLVLHESPQLVEAPVAESSSKTLCSRLLAAVANTGEILHRDTDAESLCLFDEPLADAMVLVGLKSALPPRFLLQAALGGFCSLSLVLLPGGSSPLAVALNLLASKCLASAISGDVNNTEVHTEERTGFTGLWSGFL